MTLRVTQGIIYANALHNIRAVTSRNLATSNQVATGKRVQKPSHDPSAAASAVSERAQLADAERYSRTGDSVYSRMTVIDTVMSDMILKLTSAQSAVAGARALGDSVALDLAHVQAQWVVGRNPFTQSTMYGVGYDWAQQYSVSSGDFVGSLPVGMQSRGVSDLPYWPAQNMYVYKEVWIHSTSRWLWLMADLL